ncbi:MAG: HAMP domain-containing histidine kinase [Erysipelotrichaceae bacterium]|nr:HAMP domain-containing histidine kinase [Erysipelotrichaceae bacterium]
MKKKYSLRLQLILYMVLFIVAVLGVIYLFQTNFLDTFYKKNKISTLMNVGRNVASYVGQDDIDDILDQVGMSNEVCVRVVSNNDSLSYTGACTLRNLDNYTINMIAAETIENGDEKMFDDFHYQRPFDSRPEDIYIFAKMLKYADQDVMVMVSSAITPLNVTISTLKSQYFIIALIVIIMSVILALLLSRFLLKPIFQINTESQNLSKGRYDGGRIRTGSKEYDELNHTLIQANEDILKADKARKELLGNVSHDLRTPLTMIVGYGEMMKDIPEEKNDANIDIIIAEAKRLSALVDDLIDISKIEDDNVELNKQEISLNDLLTSVYHQYQKYCETQGISFELQLSDDIRVELDEKRIRQVLYNFINNALNYNDKDDQKMILGTEKLEDAYRVYVYDNGCGIAEEDLENIWDRYYKVDKEHKRHLIGSGIGLSLSRELLEAHGLNYGVESQENEYSRFYFDVKAAEADI